MSSSWLPRSLRHESTADVLEPGIGDVLYRSLRHLVSGEPESLMGWLLLVLALLELRAGETVVWIDFGQGPAMTLGRLRDLGTTDDEIDRFLYIEPREPITGGELRDMLVALTEEKRPTLVVFDAYAGLLGLDDGDPNSERDIERVNRRVVDRFRACGAATVIVDHPVKSAIERGRYSSGSGRKLAETDVHIRLDRGDPFGRGRTGTARLLVMKVRPGGLPRPSIGTLALASCAKTGAISWELRPPDQPATTDVDRSFPADRAHGTREPLPRTPVDPREQDSDRRSRLGRAEYVRLAIDALISEQYIAAESGPRNASLLSTKRAYREATNTPRPTASDHVPTPSPDAVNDPVPRSPSLEGDGDAVDQDELSRHLVAHADIHAGA